MGVIFPTKVHYLVTSWQTVAEPISEEVAPSFHFFPKITCSENSLQLAKKKENSLQN